MLVKFLRTFGRVRPSTIGVYIHVGKLWNVTF
jgi:hypothetical protein